MPPPSERRPVPAPPADGPRAIGIGAAFGAWVAGWVGGNLLASIFIAVSGQQDTAATERPVWLIAGSSLALWLPQLAAVMVVIRQAGRPSLVNGCQLRFAPIDALGVPIGVACQLVLLKVVYWPLQHWWPGAFADDELERNARELYDRAHGIWIAVLVVIVVVGAPFVEEVVYRGLLAGAMLARWAPVVAVIGSAAFFAVIHFRPVEYPGLFAFAVVLGICLVRTGRIGMGIVAHLAFNATALILVAR